MDIVSIASFLLPTLLSMFEAFGFEPDRISLLSGEGKERLGLPMPSPWFKMIRLSAEIYKKRTPAQKQKLIDMGVLQPDFEDILIDLFDKYLAEEPDMSDYNKYRGLLLKIHPMEFTGVANRYAAFKARIRELMDKTFPSPKISNESSYHPNYSKLYEYWRKIYKIFQPSKK
jgi:hypothetical protein